ncbi:STM3941 family protein [Mesorhizobium sp. ORS 3428]|uniref:STM3941 family protein n=1 Tax=Mesorhizobium sp. ORS 3428 TaxID=540997 RepID=UPI003FCC703F
MGDVFEPLEPRIIKGSRVKVFLCLLGCAAFVCVGILMVRNPPAHPESLAGFKQIAGGWLGIIFFGLCSLIYVRLLTHPHVLILDGNGFVLSGGLIRSPRKIAWREVQGFHVRRQRRTKSIGYSLVSGGATGSSLRRAERRLPGGWSLSIENMVDVLNIYRLQALGLEAELARRA